MKIINAKQCFVVVHSIQSVVYKESKEQKDLWEISICFNNTNSGQSFKIPFIGKEECETAFEEIKKAVRFCGEYD